MNQAQLFDQSGAVLRDAGIQQAVEHADQQMPGWSDRAYVALKQFLRQSWVEGGSFMAEDIRAWCHTEYGLPRPPHSRSWGSVILRAARNGLIRKIGIEQVKNPKAHCANAALWERA